MGILVDEHFMELSPARLPTGEGERKEAYSACGKDAWSCWNPEVPCRSSLKM